MNLAFKSLIALVFLTLFSAFIKTLTNSVGIPNLMPALRDPVLALLFFYGVSKLDFYKSRLWPAVIASLTIFVFAYLCVSLFENSLGIGLYYIRLYAIPIFFYIACIGIFSIKDNAPSKHQITKLFINFNNLLFLMAVVLYALLQTIPSLRSTLFGTELLSTAWYISGGTWMRMGLPLSGPNTLGIVFAINSFVFLCLLLHKDFFLENTDVKTWKVVIGFVCASLGLLLTFSRSSMLLVIATVPALLIYSGSLNFKKSGKMLFLGLLGIAALIIFAALIDNFSDGYVERWITLNTSFKDPSMLGHVTSITDAIDNIEEYLYWGYPKGTVGAKAAIFGGVAKNVENSFIAVLYDMGLFIAIPYALSILGLLALGYKNRYQAFLLFGFSIPCFLLPYVFEADALVYFCFAYVSVGFIFGQSALAEQGSLNSPERNIVLRTQVWPR